VVGYELTKNFSVEAAYVGRVGRNLLVRRDLFSHLNLTDPQSGVDYFTATRNCSRNSRRTASMRLLWARSRTSRTCSRMLPACTRLDRHAGHGDYFGYYYRIT